MADEATRPAQSAGETKEDGKKQNGVGETPVGPVGIGLITTYLVLLSLALFLGLMNFWPPSAGDGSWPVTIWSRQYHPSVEDRFFLTVIVSGALGGMVHTLRSFYWYVGNRELKRSWGVKYLLLPFVGATLGLIFYLVIRGGFFSAGSEAGDMSPHGFAALAVLAGMFSEQAVLKLRQVAETVLTKPEQGKDHAKPDDKPNPPPEPKPPEPGSEGES